MAHGLGNDMSMNPYGVSFNADDVKAVAAGTATRSQLMAVVTSQTCGEACWHAREEVCRCSCGGANHGCLTHADGKRPERTCKMGGHFYKLKAVGRRHDIHHEAIEINRAAGYASVDKPTLVVGCTGGSSLTDAEIQAARDRGEHIWWQQYRYTWNTAQDGSPARLKTPTASQKKWQELSGWQSTPEVYLLWERVTMPERPTQFVVDKETGEPLADQNPTGVLL